MKDHSENNLTPDQQLSALFVHVGNLEMYEKIVAFYENHFKENPHAGKLKEGATIVDVHNVVALGILKDVFDILHIISLFHDQQFKLYNYVKTYFQRWKGSLADLMRELILIGLSDPRRFDFNSVGLTFIIKKIEKLDLSVVNPDETSQNPYDWITFFGGSSGVAAEPFIKAWVQVRGLLQTESETVREFIQQHPFQVLKETSLLLDRNLSADLLMDSEQEKDIVEIRNWNLQTRYYLMEKVGFFDLPFVKSIPTHNQKHIFLANILKCHPRSARRLKNRELVATDSEKMEVDLYLSELK